MEFIYLVINLVTLTFKMRERKILLQNKAPYTYTEIVHACSSTFHVHANDTGLREKMKAPARKK